MVYKSYKQNKISILGTRGIPARHGGFETFTEHFSLYLKHNGWDVTVYCQGKGSGPKYEDQWKGIRRIHIPVAAKGAKGTVIFDWIATIDAVKKRNPTLTLGYNTAIFCLLYRLKKIKNIINMDGIEWRRGKWNLYEKAWLYINEKLGAWLGSHLIADHPEIKYHLARFVSPHKIAMIPYSAELIKSANISLLDLLDLKPMRYALLIARPEPEVSILEIVRAYSKEKRGIPLVVLGSYNPESSKYQKAILKAAGTEIRFVGAIYNAPMVQALRFYSRFYIHGHTVGGTNPSLVEALGSGTPVLAHENKFNKWVAGNGALYFSTERDCSDKIDLLISDDKMIASMKKASIQQYFSNFRPEIVYSTYERLLLSNGF